nr:retrotransposon protein, putative, Ty3-gypsy subclass [Tanacetum cinerariifolium]
VDWLSKHRGKIVFHERVVQISLRHGEMLRVYGEWPEEKVKHLMSAKAEEPKLEDITIIQNFFEEELNMRQRLWIKIFSDYGCEIHYHLAKMLRGLDEQMEPKSDGALYYIDRIWVPLMGDQPEIPKWKWERIAMDFITKLPRTGSRHDSIWVIMDRLTRSAHFLPIRKYFKMDRLARLYLNKSVARHGRWDVHLSLVEFSYNNNYHSSVRCASFEALYGRKCRSPILWAKVGEGRSIGPKIV